METLKKNNIQFSRHFQLTEGPMTAGWIIDVFSTVKEATPWGAFAAALVAWVKVKSNRKCSITTKDNGVVCTKGLSVEDTIKLLERATELGVIETHHDH